MLIVTHLPVLFNTFMLSVIKKGDAFMLTTADLADKDYSRHNTKQIIMPLDYELHIKGNADVRFFDAFVDSMDLSALHATYKKDQPDDKADAAALLKVCLYADADTGSAASTRSIEEKCLYDDRYRFLLGGKKAPDHSTVSRFRSLHLAPCIRQLMAAHVKVLHDLGEADGKDIYQDGTKIRANANKYTFVWKKTVSRNLEKLALEMLDLIVRLEEAYGVKASKKGDVIDMDSLDGLLSQMDAYQAGEKINFVHGSGKFRTQFQKDYEDYAYKLCRLKDYENKLSIMGDRNSYSKTDHDSTFMRDKDDHMKNGQLVPAFNLQHVSQGGYILWVMEQQKTNDVYAVIPMIDEILVFMPFIKLDAYCADAGYESEENYVYLKNKGLRSFIKPANYEKSLARAYAKDISLMENMTYDKDNDCYICAEGKKLKYKETKKKKSRGGYVSESRQYECSECAGCPRKKECIKGSNSKTPLEERSKRLSVSKTFQELREASRQNITSEFGKQIRVNRSIQIEGSFANVKGNHGMTRYRTRGTDNVLTESIIMAMAVNIKKLHNRIQKGDTGLKLYELKEEKPAQDKTSVEKEFAEIMKLADSRVSEDGTVNDEKPEEKDGAQLSLDLGSSMDAADNGSGSMDDKDKGSSAEGTESDADEKSYGMPTLRTVHAGDINKKLVEEKKAKRKAYEKRKKEPAKRTPHEDELDENLPDHDPVSGAA